jgi:hypothetical protein
LPFASYSRERNNLRRSEVSDHPLDEKRVSYLIELLRQRTSKEIATGVMALAGSFTPEMWRALELLRLQRGPKPKRQTVLADDEI